MKKTLRRLALLSFAMVLGFASCEKDQENNDGENILIDENGEATFDVSGTIAGHDYVDLGLPSGLKWATCNVGANTPEEYGDFYAWGETITKTEYTMENSVTWMQEQELGDISGNPTYDAATANWGSTWRMPTKTEMEELRDNCTWIWIDQNNIKGYKVIGPNGNSMFFSAAGYCRGSSRYNVGEDGGYWSSTPLESNTYYAFDLYFFSGSHNVDWGLRYYGHTVRPVSD